MSRKKINPRVGLNLSQVQKGFKIKPKLVANLWDAEKGKKFNEMYLFLTFCYDDYDFLFYFLRVSIHSIRSSIFVLGRN